VLLRLVLLFASASVLRMANEQQQVPNCCESESIKLSQSQIKTLVKKTEPIHVPCCADTLHINGVVVLAISVDPQGNVTCAKMVSGDPLIIGVVIDSVKQWKFQPYNSKGIEKLFCGQLALRLQANEHAVKYKIV
jgi:outer membrane biosynthesis protein TonB